MIRHLLAKRVAPGDPDRAALEWELSELRERILQHGAESSRIYGDYAAQEAALLLAGENDRWSEMRATRVMIARMRGEEMEAMLTRESELVSMLGSDWA